MEYSDVTVSESGQLTLSDDVRDALGIPSGGVIQLLRGERSVELRKKPMSDEEAEQEIERLHALLARRPGEPSLEDELYKMRREEEAHARRKFGC